MTGTINLNEQLKNHFGFDSFKGEQEAIIRNLLEGNDTFVLMPTGGQEPLLSIAIAYYGRYGDCYIAAHSSYEKSGRRHQRP